MGLVRITTKGETSDFIGTKVDNVNRLSEAVPIGSGLDMSKSFGLHPTSEDTKYSPSDRPSVSDDIESLDWFFMWLDLTEPEAEVLFDLDGPT